MCESYRDGKREHAATDKGHHLAVVQSRYRHTITLLSIFGGSARDSPKIWHQMFYPQNSNLFSEENTTKRLFRPQKCTAWLPSPKAVRHSILFWFRWLKVVRANCPKVCRQRKIFPRSINFPAPFSSELCVRKGTTVRTQKKKTKTREREETLFWKISRNRARSLSSSRLWRNRVVCHCVERLVEGLNHEAGCFFFFVLLFFS